MKTKWEIIKEKSKDHWLEVKGDDGSRVFENSRDRTGKPIYPSSAVCKWDGCVDYRSYANGKGYGHECNDKCDCYEDYIHICDIDSFIEELQELKKVAVKYFKNKT